MTRGEVEPLRQLMHEQGSVSFDFDPATQDVVTEAASVQASST